MVITYTVECKHCGSERLELFISPTSNKLFFECRNCHNIMCGIDETSHDLEVVEE